MCAEWNNKIQACMFIEHVLKISDQVGKDTQNLIRVQTQIKMMRVEIHAQINSRACTVIWNLIAHYL